MPFCSIRAELADLHGPVTLDLQFRRAAGLGGAKSLVDGIPFEAITGPGSQYSRLQPNWFWSPRKIRAPASSARVANIPLSELDLETSDRLDELRLVQDYGFGMEPVASSSTQFNCSMRRTEYLSQSLTASQPISLSLVSHIPFLQIDAARGKSAFGSCVQCLLRANAFPARHLAHRSGFGGGLPQQILDANEADK